MRAVDDPGPEAPIRVFLLDDHEVVRRGVRDLLELEEDLTVVGDAGAAAEVRDRVRCCRPDVAVLDVQLADGSGIDVCRALRDEFPDVRCLMLSSFADDEAVTASLLAGAVGYVIKDIRGRELVDSIRAAAAGRSLHDPALVVRAARRLEQERNRDATLDSLTAQERRILLGLAEGLTNRQIGEQLFLAEKTVKNYVSNVLMKMGMERRTEAAVYAARHGVVPAEDPRP